MSRIMTLKMKSSWIKESGFNRENFQSTHEPKKLSFLFLLSLYNVERQQQFYAKDIYFIFLHYMMAKSLPTHVGWQMRFILFLETT